MVAAGDLPTMSYVALGANQPKLGSTLTKTQAAIINSYSVSHSPTSTARTSSYTNFPTPNISEAQAASSMMALQNVQGGYVATQVDTAKFIAVNKIDITGKAPIGISTPQNARDLVALGGGLISGAPPSSEYPFGDPHYYDIGNVAGRAGEAVGSATGSFVGGFGSGAAGGLADLAGSIGQSLLSNPYILLIGAVALIYFIKK